MKTKHVILLTLGLFVLMLFIIGISTETPDKKPMKIVPFNSAIDGSVYQVENYLKQTLHDPESYHSVDWSPVRTKDSIIYEVTHTFRASNKLGALVLDKKTFYIQGGEVVGTR